VRTCLHTVSYAGTWGQACLSLEETLDRAAALGFDGVMLMARRPHASVLDMPPSRVRELAARLERLGLACACIAGYTDFTAGAGHLDIPLREMQVDHVTSLCRLAHDLGCSVVRVFTGYETPELPASRAWDMCVAALRECANRAADAGVTLGVQNHHDIAAGWQAMRELLAQVDHPHCRACFDAWAPALHGEDVVAAAAEMAPLTVHTTAADYVRLPRYRYQPQLVNYVPEPDQVLAVPYGEGFIDYPGFLSALSASGYGGYVGYEMCSPLRGGGGLESLDRCARAFVEAVRPLP
jgi:sugar phosphate isomerase/epimerase